MKVMSVNDSNQNSQPIVNQNQDNAQQVKAADDKTRESMAASEIVQQIYAVQKGDNIISEKALQAAIDKANKAIIGSKREFRYSVHKETNEIMVKVVDPDTGDVVREIPPEKILDLVAKLQQLAGAFVDEKR